MGILKAEFIEKMMIELHKGIVLRANSAYRNSITVFDEHLGKIQCFVAKKRTISLFHGAFIDYSLTKRHTRYALHDLRLLDMPHQLLYSNFLFFHHVLELADYFLAWDQQITPLFQLLSVLYTNDELVSTPFAQKIFLYHFFKKLGMYPEQEIPLTEKALEAWINTCIAEHPQGLLLTTKKFLQTGEVHNDNSDEKLISDTIREPYEDMA
jgi:hypothetical protein